MKTLKAIPMILLALVPFLIAFAEPSLSSPHGRIIGVVHDANNARIVGATIKIKNARFYREVRSGEEGDFEVELPAGLYRITVEQPGFRRFELSSFRVNADGSQTVSVHMKVKEPRGLQKVE